MVQGHFIPKKNSVFNMKKLERFALNRILTHKVSCRLPASTMRYLGHELQKHHPELNFDQLLWNGYNDTRVDLYKFMDLRLLAVMPPDPHDTSPNMEKLKHDYRMEDDSVLEAYRDDYTRACNSWLAAEVNYVQVTHPRVPDVWERAQRAKWLKAQQEAQQLMAQQVTHSTPLRALGPPDPPAAAQDPGPSSGRRFAAASKQRRFTANSDAAIGYGSSPGVTNPGKVTNTLGAEGPANVESGATDAFGKLNVDRPGPEETTEDMANDPGLGMAGPSTHSRVPRSANTPCSSMHESNNAYGGPTSKTDVSTANGNPKKREPRLGRARYSYEDED